VILEALRYKFVENEKKSGSVIFLDDAKNPASLVWEPDSGILGKVGANIEASEFSIEKMQMASRQILLLGRL